MRFPSRKFLMKCVLLVVVLMATGGGWLLYMAASASVEAERNLHYSRFALRLVERFVSETGRWPHSWEELECIPMEGVPFGQEWPAASAEMKRRIFIDFQVNPLEVTRQAPLTFTVIRPIGPYYEYRDYGEVESLQCAIRKTISGTGRKASHG
jgi:hypothetical protein